MPHREYLEDFIRLTVSNATSRIQIRYYMINPELCNIENTENLLYDHPWTMPHLRIHRRVYIIKPELCHIENTEKILYDEPWSMPHWEYREDIIWITQNYATSRIHWRYFMINYDTSRIQRSYYFFNHELCHIDNRDKLLYD